MTDKGMKKITIAALTVAIVASLATTGIVAIQSNAEEYGYETTQEQDIYE